MHKALTVVAALLVSASSAGATFAQTTPEKVARIDEVLTRLHERDMLNGVVLVAEGGKVVYEKAFGYADYTARRPLTTGSVFELASVSKPFTALAVAILAEREKLSVDDDLTKHFSELPYKGITVRHLLTHTSGLPDYMDLFATHWDKTTVATNGDVVSLLAKHKPPAIFAPGERWEYSNTAYVLLATLVERASGERFADFMRRNVFEPAGMKDTRIYTVLSKEQIPNYAVGYVQNIPFSDAYVRPKDLPRYFFVTTLGGIEGDGVVNATAGDLFRFDRALYTEKLVKRATLDAIFAPGRLKDGSVAKTKSGSGIESSYGYGWFVRTADPKVFWHTGGWPGYNTYFMRDTGRDRTIIALDNGGHGAIVRAGDIVEAILDGRPYELPRPSVVKAVGPVLGKKGAAAAVARYRELKRTDPDGYNFAESQLNQLGYQLLREGKTADAVEIFKLNAEMFPSSFNVYDSLGEAYLAAGDRDRAIENYEKSVKINPESKSGLEALKKIRGEK